MKNSKARRHYLSLIDEHGTAEERMKALRPMGFTFRPFQQPHGLPSTWFEEPDSGDQGKKK